MKKRESLVALRWCQALDRVIRRGSYKFLESSEVAKRLLETRAEVYLRVPVQEPAGSLGRIDRASRLLPGRLRSALGGQVPPRDPAHPLIELVHAGLDSGADVVHPVWGFALQGKDVSPGHVRDIDVVAGLLSGAVDCRGIACGQVPGEYGHDPGLSVRVLARPVDIRVAQRGVGDAVLDAVEVEVALSG